MLFTLAVRLHDGSMTSVSVTLSPETTLREMFAAIARSLRCHPLSLSLSLSKKWAELGGDDGDGGGLECIPHPPPQRVTDEYDPILRTDVFSAVPEDRMPLRLRRALVEVHAVGQVIDKKTPLESNTPSAAAHLTSRLIIVRVLDQITTPLLPNATSARSARYVRPDAVTVYIQTVHQAIQFVFQNPDRCGGYPYRLNDSDVLRAFHQLPVDLKRNHDVVLAVLGMGQTACRLIENETTWDYFYKGNKAFVMHNIASGCFSTAGHMRPRFWDDIDVVLQILTMNQRDDFTAVGYWVESYYERVSPRLQTHPEVLAECFKRSGSVLKHVPMSVRNNRAYVMLAVGRDGLALEHAPAAFQGDFGVVSVAVENNGLSLQFTSSLMKSNGYIVRMAIANNGASIQHAADRFRCDFGTALNAIMQNPRAYGHLALELRKNKALYVMAAQKSARTTLRDAPDAFKKNRELVRVACVLGNALVHASSRLQNDPELVTASVSAHPRSLSAASPVLRGAPHLVELAMRIDAAAYESATPELRATNKPLALLYANTCEADSVRGAFRPCGILVPWRKDKDVAMALLSRTVSGNAKTNTYCYMDASLQNDTDVVEQAFVNPGAEGGALDKRYTDLWDDPTFVHALIEKHLHNPGCEMLPLLRLPCVKSSREMVYKMLPRCNLHNSYLGEDVVAMCTVDKQMVLRLLKFHPYVFDFPKDEAYWAIPDAYRTDADVLKVLELARPAKRRRLE
jgi:hypothetical protein